MRFQTRQKLESQKTLRARSGGDECMIAVVRVRGTANISPDHRKTLELLMLHKPNHAILVAEELQLAKMVEKVKDYVTYGEIDLDTAAELLRKRGRTIE